eukprot:10595911-Alexandrium_andersonii.AAC.1
MAIGLSLSTRHAPTRAGRLGGSPPSCCSGGSPCVSTAAAGASFGKKTMRQSKRPSGQVPAASMAFRTWARRESASLGRRA